MKQSPSFSHFARLLFAFLFLLFSPSCASLLPSSLPLGRLPSETRVSLHAGAKHKFHRSALAFADPCFLPFLAPRSETVFRLPNVSTLLRDTPKMRLSACSSLPRSLSSAFVVPLSSLSSLSSLFPLSSPSPLSSCFSRARLSREVDWSCSVRRAGQRDSSEPRNHATPLQSVPVSSLSHSLCSPSFARAGISSLRATEGCRRAEEAADQEREESSAFFSADAPALSFEVLQSRAKPVREDAPALLVVHGLLGSRRNMRSFSALLNSPKIVAVDLRNHGDSPWRDQMRVSDLGRDLLYMLHSKPDLFSSSALASSSSLLSAPRDVVLVGHSLGGLAAMYAALRAEEASRGRDALPRVKGLVVLDVAPVDYSGSRQAQQPVSSQTVVNLLCDLPMSAFEDRRQLERTLGATDPPLPRAMIQWLMTAVRERREKKPLDGGSIAWRAAGRPSRTADKTLKKDEKIRLEWRMNLLAIKQMLKTKQLRWPSEEFDAERRRKSRVSGCRDTAADAPVDAEGELGRSTAAEGEQRAAHAFEGPALFLRGSNSQYVDVKRDWDTILRYFPNAEHRTVQNAGHWLHAEQPVQTAELINQFLAKV
ncbi:hydrolase, alpha/beta fold family protein [Toxoplasma gondii VEG]|uniref:Hydrolase, alpha/beta fold family domain-containing protein n=1 Tax=Toxoplasma gondii (strain ATCC 50861 / VEG) TaxID=432359 RepID=V4ZC29_TOXGV|nr:hydrolase, alpha/beta fold family protein [Toxoplasma gondii VEG]CEL73425.1 TPA: hydrolase, alpha/beta fold family domain-containing protein [Toxoplasma gondii VEG]